MENKVPDTFLGSRLTIYEKKGTITMEECIEIEPELVINHTDAVKSCYFVS